MLLAGDSKRTSSSASVPFRLGAIGDKLKVLESGTTRNEPFNGALLMLSSWTVVISR